VRCLWLSPVLIALLAASRAPAQDRKLTIDERIELIRGLTAEYATAKTPLPQSKSPLIFDSKGSYDQGRWLRLGRETGQAARTGDLIQITKVELEDERIVLEINGGIRGGRKWYERIQVGTNSRTVPLGRGSGSATPAGTSLAVVFPGRVPPLKAEEVKKLLAPIFDFDRRSASETYVETLPPEIQQAVKEKKAAVGMNRDQVLLALGHPDNKVRTTEDGTEYEDWIFGRPPGRIVFVTFEGNDVVRVKEAYANVGGSVAAPLPTPR